MDLDTILKELTDNANMEVIDVSMELLDIWDNSDCEAVESLFLFLLIWSLRIMWTGVLTLPQDDIGTGALEMVTEISGYF